MSQTKSQLINPIDGNINVTGIVTANNVVAGAAQTALVVLGDARITGILTIGTGSITLDGSTNNITGISSITDTSNRKLVALNTGGTNVALWYQATSPIGWTKVTTHNNKALRVVSGNGGGFGGSIGFTTAFTTKTPSGSVSGANTNGSVSNTTLDTTQIPSHTHTYQRNNGAWNTGTSGNTAVAADQGQSSPNTSSTGGGSAHGHGFTNPTWSGSFSGDAIDFSVQYIDMILCSFD